MMSHKGSPGSSLASISKAPQQSYNAIGKVLFWGQGRDGVWNGVIISNGYRWTFAGRDILCDPADLVEGQQVSFRSVLPEDFHGNLGCADQVQPSDEPLHPQPQTETLRIFEQQSEPKLPQHVLEEKRGVIVQYAPETNTGVISADGKDYLFYGTDILRGFAAAGKAVKFKSSDRTFAVDLEI